MKRISSEIIEKTLNEIGTMEPKKTEEMIQQMTEEQPIILAYLMATGGDLFNTDERGLLLYLGIITWRIMSYGKKKLPKITEKMLFDTENKNFKMLEDYSEKSESEFVATVEKMVAEYNQPDVLGYAISILMEQPKGEIDITEENKGTMLICLKTVIDSFDKN